LPPGVPAGTRADVRKGFVYKRVSHVTLKSIANNPDIREGMSRKEIDTAIARHADSELLYDQPYEDKTRVRVAGPFTVESLAPHRTVAQPERPVPVQTGGASYEQTMLDNLKKAGVQNGWRSERLTFDRIEPFAGQWIQAIGHAVGEPGRPERVGIALGRNTARSMPTWSSRRRKRLCAAPGSTCCWSAASPSTRARRRRPRSTQ